MADYNIDEAYPLATPETQKYTLDYFKHLLTIVDSNYIASNTPASTAIDSVVHIDDTQAVVYYHKKTPLHPHLCANVEMRLRDGQWLAHQPINPMPFSNGAIKVIDTAEMANTRMHCNDSVIEPPTKIVPLVK